MGALTASGGYYISMPGQHLFAEPTTITGSIGVYASFPNIAGLAKEYGFGMNVIKAGEVKDSGSMFKEMTPEERHLWQDMVDHAFVQFQEVVEDGRPKLKGKLRVDIPEETKKLTAKVNGKDETYTYTRKRADGGIYTADKALKYGLVDQIGYAEDAVKEAAKRAGLGNDYRAFSYERPPSLMDVFMRSQAPAGGQTTTAAQLSRALTPRVWYLEPQSEIAGLLSAAGPE
jgi:protease-4